MYFKNIRQPDAVDCGPTCLKMIFAFYGKDIPMQTLRDKCFLHRMGVSLVSLKNALLSYQCKAEIVKIDYDALTQQAPLPIILHWNQEHFVVLYKVSKPVYLFGGAKNWRKEYMYIADPAHGKIKIEKDSFIKSWASADGKGVALIIQPTVEFDNIESSSVHAKSYSFLAAYLRPFRKSLLLLLFGMLLTTVTSLIFPFLTQYMVDNGVVQKDLSLITLIVIAQLLIFLGDITLSITRGWVVLHMNARVSISIISDFLAKLLRLPVRFFDSKTIGDITQRVADHIRIENFLTGQVLSTFFSIINIVVYLFLLLTYDIKIFLIYFVLSFLSVVWVLKFMHKRRDIDYRRFQSTRQNQDNLYEIVMGMSEIKLNLAEKKKRWGWERLQVALFQINIKSLNLEQLQRTGFLFFSNLKNLLLTYVAASETIKGNMTLGALLAISYIIGQTNSPLEQIINFLRSAQDASLSMERLQEIHNKSDEDLFTEECLPSITDKRGMGDISISHLGYQYDGPDSPLVLNDVSFRIPAGKVTAIVGSSGSGKTTLLKLLLKFYEPVAGVISVGAKTLEEIPARYWRSNCGTVMQDGYIFADTIVNNITLSSESNIDEGLLEKAIYCSNLSEYLNILPLKLNTRLGLNGQGLSMGQKQRLLLARAIYKNPDYLFFDEATSALDANNEKIIVERLKDFYSGRTVVIIAHRLSTVRNADQIIVLDRGKVIESGNHSELTCRKEYYYELIKNQLELGN